MSKILVTGASGFIGLHLCKRLALEGNEVHAISRGGYRSPDDHIKWWQADFQDPGEARVLFRNIHPQIVFHLSSRVTGSRDLSEVVPTFQANLASTVSLLVDAAEEGCQRVVLAGSCEAPLQGEEQTLCSPYAATKWCSAGYADMFRTLFCLSVSVPRIFITYGPGPQDIRKIIPYTILSMLRGERPKLSSGRRMVDWIYVDDVVEGLIRAASTTVPAPSSFDLGSGSLVSIRSLVNRISEIIDNGIEPEFGALPDRPFEHERVADTSILKHTFGWSPSTSLDDGLKKTVNWFKSSREFVARIGALILAILTSESLWTCLECLESCS